LIPGALPAANAHVIYGISRGGAIELVIDMLVASASVAALTWSWHYKALLLKQAPALQERQPA
jgi:hypothetical protein